MSQRHIYPGKKKLARTDAEIKRTWLERAKKYPREFDRTVRGLTCELCGSRKTSTEFYRYPYLPGYQGSGATGRPMFGVTACDDCGAC